MTAGSSTRAAPRDRARRRPPVRTASPLAAVANTAWRASLLSESAAFVRACREVAGTQEKLLMRLLDRNGDSEFGQRHRFGAMRCVDDYRTGVPLSTYEDYRKAVERIAQGVPGVLTSEPVVLLEPTSGSTGPSKLIPYTRSLKAEFRRAIAPWIVDMFARHPGLLWGQSYWSVSPVVRRDEYSESGIPIGFEDDSEYLGSFGRMLVRNVLAVPTGVRLLEDMDTFRYVTLLFLLRSRSLSMISIWHPTFLTLLLEPLDEWLDRLTDDIATGRLTPTGAMPAETGRQLRSAMRPDPERASEIENCLASASHVGEASPALWPRLGLVSCWADGNAGPYLPALTALFPHATCQPKGLVSTEGVASIPRHGRRGAALAVRSHFFEFLPQDSSPDGETVLAHELEADRRYSLVMTTGGGLYRYLTGDLVDVVSHIDSCPLFEFAGKDAHISDRFGEKLNSVHVQQALDRAVARYNIAPDFAIVAFEDAPGCPGYTLFIESHDASDQELLTLGAALEESLQENYHYRYCRDLGQLGRLRLFRIETGAQRTYATTCQENGQRIGDLKPPALHTMAGWSQSFSGRFLERGVPPVPGGATA